MATSSTTRLPSLDSLPVEILYRILDYVDGQTIIFSFRNVCKRFESITNTFNRHELDTSWLSKADLNFIGTAVSPEHVMSLTLSGTAIEPGPIDLFFSLFNVDRCTRLRSLTLANITDSNLQTLLRHVISSFPLISLSVEFPPNESSETLALFVSVISQPILRRLTVNLNQATMRKFKWSSNCSLEYLDIAACTLEQFCTILDHSPNLRTLVIRNQMDNHNDRAVSKCYPQLISLSLCNLRCNTMKSVESILTLTPSLTYLKMIDWHADTSMRSGSHWKNLIMTHLPHLDKFEFFFGKNKSHQIVSHDRKSAEVENCIARFSKAFWLRTKQWAVGCTYDVNMESIFVYSIPICLTLFSYEHHNRTTTTDSTTMVNIKDDLQFSDQTENTVQPPPFSKLSDLKLRIRSHHRTDLFNLFLTWVNPSHLVTLAVTVHLVSNSMEESIAMLRTLLERTDNLHSLTVSYRRARTCRMQTARSIYAVLPQCIKDLEIETIDVDDLHLIFGRLSHLSVVRLAYSKSKRISDLKIIQWLRENVTDFIHQEKTNRIDVWLGTYINKPRKIKTGAKRIKLSHDS